MNSLSENKRIGELEVALANCAEYLRRMPMVPETLAQLREIDAVLRLESTDIPNLRGANHAASGLLVLEVRMNGTKAVVSTDVPEKWEHRLWEVLRDGVTVELKYGE